MSTPQHPHHLRRGEHDEDEAYFRDGSKAGQYVPRRYSQMRCDGAMGLCILEPARAPQIMVPPRPFVLTMLVKPLRVWTTYHYCERHKDEAKVQELLLPKMRSDLERLAKHKWPQEYTPDFDAAYINWVLVTTPEYRKFLETLELGRLVSREGVQVL